MNDTTSPTADMTDGQRQVAWTLGAEVEGLLRAIERAQTDLATAKGLLLQGSVPYGSLGRVLSQSALDVDSRGARLQVVLEVVGAAGLTNEQVQGVLAASVAKVAR